MMTFLSILFVLGFIALFGLFILSIFFDEIIIVILFILLKLFIEFIQE